jgi:hypothetical protein
MSSVIDKNMLEVHIDRIIEQYDVADDCNLLSMEELKQMRDEVLKLEQQLQERVKRIFKAKAKHDPDAYMISHWILSDNSLVLWTANNKKIAGTIHIHDNLPYHGVVGSAWLDNLVPSKTFSDETGFIEHQVQEAMNWVYETLKHDGRFVFPERRIPIRTKEGGTYQDRFPFSSLKFSR